MYLLSNIASSHRQPTKPRSPQPELKLGRKAVRDPCSLGHRSNMIHFGGRSMPSDLPAAIDNPKPATQKEAGGPLVATESVLATI